MDLVDLNISMSRLNVTVTGRDPYGSRGSKFETLLPLYLLQTVEILMDLVDLNFAIRFIASFGECVEILMDLVDLNIEIII